MTDQVAKPEDVWTIFLDEHGPTVRTALSLLQGIPADVFLEGRRRIDVETTMGPLTDPSAYLNGKRFDNARGYTKILRVLAER